RFQLLRRVRGRDGVARGVDLETGVSAPSAASGRGDARARPRFLREESPVHRWRTGAVGPQPLREYRASRRYHILWTSLKEAAARIASLEQELEQSGARIAELEETLWKTGVPASSPEKD